MFRKMEDERRGCILLLHDVFKYTIDAEKPISKEMAEVFKDGLLLVFSRDRITEELERDLLDELMDSGWEVTPAFRPEDWPKEIREWASKIEN